MDWQPIETAPKSERISLWCPQRGFQTGYWNDDRYATKRRPCWRTDGAMRITSDRQDQPTHWAPLPSWPEEEGGT